MKKMMFVFAALVVSMLVQAQGDKSVKELGIVFNNSDLFGLTYRFGTESAVWRFNAASIGGSVLNSDKEGFNTTNINNLSFDFSVGREYRKQLNNAVDFRFGADVSYSFLGAKTKTDSDYDMVTDDIMDKVMSKPGLNLVFGLHFKHRNFLIGAEVKPGIQYIITTEEATTAFGNRTYTESSTFSYGFTSSPVQFSVVYQF